MSQSYEFYFARAEEAAKEAANATLENVRERALRSESAWREMAERALYMQTEREKTLKEKEERRAAEAAAAAAQEQEAVLEDS